MALRKAQATPAAANSDLQGPVRTCVGCGKRDSQSVLVRLVMNGSQLEVDHDKIKPGRGAYVHPSQECYARAHKRQAIGRALRNAEANSAEITLISPGP